jgi:glutathione S-transferase
MVTSASDRLLLYHHPLSHACQIVRLCLAEKGVRARLRTLDRDARLDVYDPWFVELNPEMSVPVLRHEARVLVGPMEICRYVDGAFQGPLLDHRQEAEPWMELAQSVQLELLEYAHRRGAGRRALRRRFDRLEARAESNPRLAGHYIREAERIDALARSLDEPDTLAAVERQLEVVLDRAEAALAHREYLTGDTYTLADVFWLCLLARLQTLGYNGLWHGGERPMLAAYWERLKDRPALAEAGVRAHVAPRDVAGLWLASHWEGVLRGLLLAGLAAAGWLVWRLYGG